MSLASLGAAGAAFVACSGGVGLPAAEAADGGTDAASDDPTSSNSPLCPASLPSGGTGCPSVGLVCRYASGCSAKTTATCSSAGTWGVSVPDCATRCQATLPASGTPCSIPGLACDYGSDPRPTCRDQAACTSPVPPSTTGAWGVARGACEPMAACPASAPKTDDPCAADTVCPFGDQTCVCYDRNENCGACTGPNRRWSCAPNPPAPCPLYPPNLGAACDAGATVCGYGICPGLRRAAFVCKDGAWTHTEVDCTR